MDGVFPASWRYVFRERNENTNNSKRKRLPESKEVIGQKKKKNKSTLLDYKLLASSNPPHIERKTSLHHFPDEKTGRYVDDVSVSSSTYTTSHPTFTLDWTFGMERPEKYHKEITSTKYQVKNLSPTEEKKLITQRNGKRENSTMKRSNSVGYSFNRGRFISEDNARKELATLRERTNIALRDGKWKFTSIQGLLQEVMRLSKKLPAFESTDQTFGSPKWRNRDIATESIHFMPKELKDMNVHPVWIKGDGNCGPRCFSRVLWGTDEHHIAVRLWMGIEILRYSDYYHEKNQQFDWEVPKVVKEGLYVGGEFRGKRTIYDDSHKFKSITDERDGSVPNIKREQLKNKFRDRVMKKKKMKLPEDEIRTEGFIDILHFQAMANVLNRLIILYVSENIGRHCRYSRFSFLPDREKENITPKHPLVIMWANSNMDHFVPVVPIINGSAVAPVPSHDMPLWPIPKPYGTIEMNGGEKKRSNQLTEEEISEIVNKYTILTHPILKDPK